MFCFIYSQQCIKVISSGNMCGFISFVFKKIIPNNTTPTFQEVGGVTQPRIFCQWHKNFLWYRVKHHKIDWFLLWRCIYTFLPLFSIEINQDVNSWLNSFCPWEDFKSYFLFVLVYKISYGFNTMSIKCAWQKYQHITFLNYCQLYIFKMCALWDAIFRRKIGALLCFLNGFGITVPVFIY